MSEVQSDETTPTLAGFDALGLKKELLEALTLLGYEEPTPVQRSAIPPLLAGRDVVGLAATGTGKTAAFALPMLQMMERGSAQPYSPTALIIVPTRELAMQVTEAIHKYGKSSGIVAVAVYGGQEIFKQLKPLQRGVDIVVATPGRAIDHLRRKSLKLERVKMVVLDEADEMLDLGFADDLDTLLKALPATRQTALFSATLAPRIASIAEKHLKDPVRVKIEAVASTAGTKANIAQFAYAVPRGKKDAALARIIDFEGPQSAIVFCRTRLEVERVAEMLAHKGLTVIALHGGMSQEQRDRVLKGFKAGDTQILVATDVAARGLDVKHLSHVINHDLPTSPEVYVHRIGRTGRAGNEGRAISLVEPRESRLMRSIEYTSKTRIPVAALPGSEQVMARKLERTTARVTDRFEGKIPEPVKAALEELLKTKTAEEVALATLAALHEAIYPARPEDNENLDEQSARAPRSDSRERSIEPRRESAPRRDDRPPRRDDDRPPRRDDRPPRRDDDRPPRREEGARPKRANGEPGMATLFISVGTAAGIRPQDLVGAIANEAGISSRDIGAIDIQELHSLVDVAEEHKEKVLEKLKGSAIRGRKFRMEPYKDPADRGAPPKRSLPGSSGGRSPEAAPAPRTSAPRARPSTPRTPRASAPRASAPRAPRASAPKTARPAQDRPYRPAKSGAGGSAPPERAPWKKGPPKAPFRDDRPSQTKNQKPRGAFSPPWKSKPPK